MPLCKLCATLTIFQQLTVAVLSSLYVFLLALLFLPHPCPHRLASSYHLPLAKVVYEHSHLTKHPSHRRRCPVHPLLLSVYFLSYLLEPCHTYLSWPPFSRCRHHLRMFLSCVPPRFPHSPAFIFPFFQCFLSFKTYCTVNKNTTATVLSTRTNAASIKHCSFYVLSLALILFLKHCRGLYICTYKNPAIPTTFLLKKTFPPVLTLHLSSKLALYIFRVHNLELSFTVPPLSQLYCFQI